MTNETKLKKALKLDRFINNLNLSNLPVAMVMVAGNILCTNEYYTDIVEPLIYILVVLVVGVFAMNACERRKVADKSERFLKRYWMSLTDPCIITLYTAVIVSAIISRFLWESILGPIGFILAVPFSALIMTWVRKNVKEV